MMPIFISDGQGSKSIFNELPFVVGDEIIYGIDVSWHNDPINWEEVKKHKMINESIEFAIIKATEGGDLIDSQFKNNWENSKKHGFIRGAYHFFTTYTDPKLQAENYLNTVNFESGDFVAVLDLEKDGKNHFEKKNLVKNVLIWLTEVENKTGKKPVIYTNHLIYNKYIKENLIDYDIWLADYSVYDPFIHDIPKMVMWQHSDRGQVLGINKNVDLSLFFGSQYKFKKYLLD